jgi:AraC-like DNA-binding protein
MLLNKLLSNLSVHVEPFALCTMSKGWRLCLPGPPGLLFHFVLEGTGVLYGPRKDVHPIHPLHLAVVPAGAKHVLESSGDIREELRIDAPPSGEQVCHIVAGSTDEPDLVVGCGIVNVRYGPSLDLFDNLHDVLAVDMSSVPEALTAFKGILAEQSQAIAGSEAMTAALMTQCLVHLFRRLPSEDEVALPWLTALQDERLARVIDMILDDPGADYSVESLADTAAMSRSAFAEHFAKCFNRSPMSFVNHVRMQRAAEYLAVGKLSIDEVAKTVGYASRSHFSRAFKDHSGLSPAVFRVESPTVQIH